MSTDAYAEDMLGEDGCKGEERTWDSRASVDEKPREGNSRFQGRQRRPFGPPVIGHEVVTLSEKIMLPVKEFPRYNFVGKLLGPKGSNLKEMQAFAKVRMSILGRGSTKDRSKEEELSQSDDVQYAHLKEPLHVIVSVKAPRIEAHRRLASAFRELNKFMGPVNEEMSQGDYGATVGEAVIGRGRESTSAMPPQPKLCFGVPPPGAIILNEQPGMAQSHQARLPRTEERVPPSRDSYAYDVAYGGGGDRSSVRRADKRPTSSNGFPLKRYKHDSQYTTR